MAVKGYARHGKRQGVGCADKAQYGRDAEEIGSGCKRLENKEGRDMNERELIRWAKTNCVCWAGLTPEQREFLERHKKDVGRYFGYDDEMMQATGVDMTCSGVGSIRIPPIAGCDGYVFRLRPDYEPEPELRWYVNRQTHQVVHASDAVSSRWLEVTPEYANYLRKSLGDGWELRMGKVGDVAISRWGGHHVTLNCDLKDVSADDRGIRWVKVKPRMGWREYRVEPELFSGDWCIVGKHSASASYTYLDNAPRIPGFGGTQYRRPNGTLTDYVATLVFMTDEGPATPVKVRFWEAI